MKFFIDTANLSQIQEAHDMGVLDGVTTNPSLMAKEGINIEMISTSEIKISMVIHAKYGELAVRALHSAYQLDK